MESSAYGHDNIGAYLDDGTINKLPLPPGSEVTSVSPQVYSSAIIKDTLNWVKIEGSFTATGNETHITIGNFAPNAAVDTDVTNYWFGNSQYSYYLIDDVSVVPLDWKANAGNDTWVELGKKVSIGDTSAEGIDSKWYHKGSLIDSGGVIKVKAATIANMIDTYVVVQTVCGIVKSDTVTVKTTRLDIPHAGVPCGGFTVYPNPSKGTITLSFLNRAKWSEGSLHTTIYDLLGRNINNHKLQLNNDSATFSLKAPDGLYILELQDEEGNIWREWIEIRQ